MIDPRTLPPLNANGQGASSDQLHDDTIGERPIGEQILGFRHLFELPRPEPLIDGLLYRRELAQLSGGPGSLKSFLALAWTCALATGQPTWEGHSIPRRAAVMYVAAEGGSGLALRIAAWCQSTGVTPDQLDGALFVLPEPVQLGVEGRVREIIDAVKLRDTVELLIIDTRSLCTAGTDENSAKDQSAIIEKVKRIIRETGCAVLVIHHCSRAGADGGGAGRGSSVWDGAVWSDLRLSRKDDTLTLEIAKHKDAPDKRKLYFTGRPWTVTGEWAQMFPAGAELETLIITQQGGIGRAVTDASTAEKILQVFRDCAGSEGLSKVMVAKMLTERGEEISASGLYAAFKKLVKNGQLLEPPTGRGGRLRVP